MRKNKDEILKYVNENLKDYEGYIQLMGKKIDKEQLFLAGERTPSLGKDDLIYEAHFFSENSNKSVSIRQINDGWLVNETVLGDINLDPEKNPDVQKFYSKFKPEFSDKFKDVKIKIVQIWEEKNDEFCKNLPVLKLQKTVFAGFLKDKKDKK